MRCNYDAPLPFYVHRWSNNLHLVWYVIRMKTFFLLFCLMWWIFWHLHNWQFILSIFLSLSLDRHLSRQHSSRTNFRTKNNAQQYLLTLLPDITVFLKHKAVLYSKQDTPKKVFHFPRSSFLIREEKSPLSSPPDSILIAPGAPNNG